MSPWRATLAAGAVVVLAAAAICLAADVGLGDLLRFAGYELGFVIGPGCGLAWLLLGRRPALELVAIGWALGYALEICAFIAASALGVRGLFSFYPIPALLLLVGLLMWRRPGIAPIRVPPLESFATAGIGVLALLFIAGGLFEVFPLPWKAAGVSYISDFSWHLTIIGEAKHHWPLTDANVSGIRLWYQVWSHLDMAATSNVTGLEPVLLLLRLFPISLTILVVLQLALVGRRLVGRAWSGPLTAALAVGVGELDSQAGNGYPFLGYFGTSWWESPSFLLGLAFFLPALLLVCELIRSPEPFRDAWGRWTAAALLLGGAFGAKTPTIPVLGGALAIYLLLRLWRTRRLERPAVTAFGVVCGVFAVFYALMYRHAGYGGLRLDPLKTARAMPQFAEWRRGFGGVPGPLFWGVAVLVAPFASYGALAAVPTIAAQGRSRLGRTELLLLCVLAVGFVPFFLGSQFGASQIIFSHYGYVAACVLGAGGLLALGERAERERPGGVAAAAVFAAAWLVAVGMLELVALPWFSPAPPLLKIGVPGAGVLAVAGLLLARRRLRGAERGWAVAAGTTLALVVALALWKAAILDYWNVPYVLLVAVAGGLAMLALGTARDRRAGIWLMLVLSVLVFGLFDQPLDSVPNRFLGLPGKRFDVFVAGNVRMSNDLYRGLLWLRANSSTDDVIAVDNYYEPVGPVGLHRSPSYFFYAAFAERRVFLEGWLFTRRANQLGASAVVEGRLIPYPERLRLNNAVFIRGDPRALQILVHRYGVRYLLVDRLNGFATARVRALGKLVFRNPAVAIYRVASA
ncbi:MAG: hypothetical protein QOG29_1690 [Gaiellaceae bacterium]|nr:hypothetical protein [Gaiellaceae bacterium]